ncbi:MAG: histone deacetylase [Chloroflexi bacterium RBG_16_50_9]|nr:MAG: histone deacetylase [Chloroflexi bacterium RBG_16_50_9]
MFRIRRVYDDVIPEDKEAITRAQEILKAQFPKLSPKEVAELPQKLRNPLKYRFRSILFIADDSKGRIKGFALVFHEPVLHFCFLDFLSASKNLTGRGIGGALYARVREEALSLNSIGLFFECLPDSPKLSLNPEIRKQNVARLRFYERYGARPIINTAYETPLLPGNDNPPYLVFDNLGQETELSRDKTLGIVRTILERKYARLCPVDYIDMVVESIKDDPVQLRKPKYIKSRPVITVKHTVPVDKRITLIVNKRHIIHHVHELGYVEAPARIESILKEMNTTDIFQHIKANRFGEKRIKAVHDKHFVEYLKRVSASLEPGKSIYPYVFPIRNQTRPPRTLAIRAGYYCIDTFTPINRNAFLAAKGAVDCALTAANAVLNGQRLAYALVRPPGHHAERRSFGGFCYFNSAAAAAQYLSAHGKIAILDIDYHHGNGQQEIFYERSDVLTISIHGQPSFAYPYFSGFASEKGNGAGAGYNINFPLPEKIDGEKYRPVLKRALNRLTRFKPRFLIIALGLDTAAGDPTGTWSLQAQDFEANGKMIGMLHLPTIVVQEGGYDTQVLGTNARHFFSGLWAGTYLA